MTPKNENSLSNFDSKQAIQERSYLGSWLTPRSSGIAPHIVHRNTTKILQPLEFASQKIGCPCGLSKSYTPHKHSSGGKCWSPKCNQKYFAPNRNSTIGDTAPQTSVEPRNESKPIVSVKRNLEYIRSHVYWTPDGKRPLMKVIVFRDLGTNKKQVFQYRFNAEKQSWDIGLKGIELTLYNAPMLRYLQGSTMRNDVPVLIVEGEKDVDSLTDERFADQLTADYIGTCNPMGAGKWRESYSKLLAGLNCIVIPDHDQPGIDHAQQVFQSVKRYAKTVKIIYLQNLLPDFPPKGDLTDFLELGGVL